MSTNPFRRSSLKGPGGGSGDGPTNPVASAPIPVSDPHGENVVPLSVKTKAPTSTQKHVNFASPPAIPISPVYYPPSPESTRTSPELNFARPVLPSPTDYSTAIQSDPFRAVAESDENDGAIEQALENAKVNTALVAPTMETSKQDAVRNTLSRFASAPRKPVVDDRDGEQLQNPTAHRQTIDVDAFKRLLLTGDSGAATSQDSTTTTTAPPSQAMINDNSSATDTASLSQRSVFDQGSTNPDSPRTSAEIEPDDIEPTSTPFPSTSTTEGKRRPPPPAPKHGKRIKEHIEPAAIPVNDQVLPTALTASTMSRKPPTPPLARRTSQNSGIERPVSSRQSSSSEIEAATRNSEANAKAAPPPPPRSRRPVSMIDRRSSSDLPTTVEEPDATGTSTAPSRKTSESRPAPPPSRNSSKRLSMGLSNPPPAPPPRRNRGSSRSSVDSQRPPMSVILNDNSANQPEGTGHSHHSGSTTSDLLSDLAALQREVDEVRRRTSR